MTSAWQDALRGAWNDLRRHPPEIRSFRTRRLSTGLALDAYAAIRAVDDAPCLLLAAEITAEFLFEVGGMRLSVVAGENGPLVVLSLEDRNRADLFTTICADALATAETADAGDALDHFLARLGAWRRFLREHRTGLSQEEMIGLFGELVVYERLVTIDRRASEAWTAPEDGLHDFVREGRAIEVKTGLGPASTVRISSLDQLETSGLQQLNLLHVKLVEDPAGTSIEELIAAIQGHLEDDRSRRAFDNSLLRRGLMPDDATTRGGLRARVRAIEAYTIADHFPSLVRSAVPSAIVEAAYELEVRSIARFAADADALLNQFMRQ